MPAHWDRVIAHGELGWRLGRYPESTLFVSDSTPLGRHIGPELNRQYALAQLTPDEEHGAPPT